MPRKKKAPTLGEIAEQTRASWARHIKSYGDVPTVYRDFFESLQARGQPFPYTVLTPSYQGFLRRATERLICLLSDEVDVLERSGNSFNAHRFALDGISYVEVRDVLLDSHVKISGATREGLAKTCTLRFNSVTAYLFRPVVRGIRLATGDATDAPQPAERDEFGHLVTVNYKFMNYARRSLLPGEEVIQAILQPEIRDRLLTAFGRTFFRTVSPTHMTILTDRELIMIREEYSRSAEERYGGAWTYMPLSKVVALSQSARGGGLLGLSVQLPGGGGPEGLFEASLKPEVDRLVARFGELVA